jgi:RNA polymerase sigma factor (sigma-70 family)
LAGAEGCFGGSGLVGKLMSVLSLPALQQGDPDAWNEAHNYLWPTALAVARLKLEPFLPADIEDVALEALEELVEKVREIKSVAELKPLTASIAHNRAVSRLREHFAKKRGAGQIESLEARQGAEMDFPESMAPDSPLAALEQKELAELLGKTLAALKPPQGEILGDFFLRGLSYDEIAKKQGLAVGSVGVYLKRGLETLRGIWRRNSE